MEAERPPRLARMLYPHRDLPYRRWWTAADCWTTDHDTALVCVALHLPHLLSWISIKGPNILLTIFHASRSHGRRPLDCGSLSPKLVGLKTWPITDFAPSERADLLFFRLELRGPGLPSAQNDHAKRLYRRSVIPGAPGVIVPGEWLVFVTGKTQVPEETYGEEGRLEDMRQLRHCQHVLRERLEGTCIHGL